MPNLLYPIANGFYKDDSSPISAQECVGWIPNFVTAPALNQEVCFGQPGLTERSNVGVSSSDINRGSLTFKGRAYFVQGGNLYRHNEDSTNTLIDPISGTGRVTMAENGSQMMILIPGGAGFIFTDDPDTLVSISAAGFTANGAPQYVIYIDSFFVATTDEKKFIKSAANDGTSWDALDVGPAESSTDDAVVPFKLKNQLFIAGTDSIEGQVNSPSGADFPFIRSGLFLDEGISAPFSGVNVRNSFLFVGKGKDESPGVWQLIGNSTVKVSTPAIDSILGRLTQAEEQAIFATSYSQRGQFFARFTLPNTTFVYNTITERWHEEKTLIKIESEIVILASRINSITTAYGKLLVGDSQDGRIGEIDVDVYKEYGNPILRRIAGQPFNNRGKPFFVPSIELTMQAGVGNDDAPDPQVRMDRSTDGGHTFGPERSRSIGKVGEYKRRTIWRRNGRASRYEIFRWTMTDAVKPVLIQATANVMVAA